MSTQRYVANELTHFVGRGLTENEQYELLVHQILKPGLLTYPPHDISMPRRSVKFALDKTISDGEMIVSPVVCFCDIPLADLEIHMKKYSQFGISFRRQLLVDLGANPMFYVANNSTVWVNELLPLDHLESRIKQAQENGKIDRGLYFDSFLKVILDLLWILDSLTHNYQARSMPVGDRESQRSIVVSVMNKVFALQEHELDNFVASQGSRHQFGEIVNLISDFLFVGLFDFIKCFDATKSETDDDNYYMEREWRVPANIRFSLDDVERIIIPRSFATKFRTDVPDYKGQLHFID